MRVIVCLLLASTVGAAEGDLVSFDFDGDEPLAGDRLVVGGDAEMRVVEGGPDGSRCLLVQNKTPGKYAAVTLRGPFELVRNLCLEFDVRAECEPPGSGQYVGVLWFDPQGKQFFGSAKFQDDWQHVVLPVARQHPANEGTLRLGMTLDRVNLYGRAKDDQPALMRVWFDNIRLTAAPVELGLSGKVRSSYANPPLFDWPRSDGPVTLAYSPDPTFPADATTTVEAPVNWYLPPAPLAPGRWYWRVRIVTELTDAWTATETVDIPAEAHRFAVPRLPLDEVAARPHPRLVDVAAERAARREGDLAALVRRAESIYNEGIADDCPIFVEGDPRWPTWIDWYGKAHGGITSRAGARLQELGKILMITGDPQVLQWTRELALKAARWDPLGGSNIRRGDIGAHHFLRGLNWCYDALAGRIDPAEQDTLRNIIVVRAEQFDQALRPFPGGENNNHAWLKAMGLAESGLVLAGEVPEAAIWAQFVNDLYIGRFLCTLGYQGDNNEGIAYWGYGLGFVIDYADLVRHAYGIDLFQHPWLAQTTRFPLFTAPPRQYAISFADTGMPNHGVFGPAATAQVRRLAERTRDPYGLWYAGARAPVGDLAPRPPVDLPHGIWYRHIGWALFHTSLIDGRDGVSVGMRIGPFWAGHQHEDLNAFVIHAYGQKLAIDGGYYDWYGSPHFKGYSTLTRAHNTILVNGEDQDSRREGADGRIAAWFDSPGYGYTVGDVSDPDVYHGQVQRFDRRLIFIKPGFVVVHDRLASTDGPKRWDWLLHALEPIEADPPARAFRLSRNGVALSGRFLAPADTRLEVSEGFPVEPVDRYSTRPVPPEQYEKEWHLTATPAVERPVEDFFAVLRIDRGEPRWEAEPVAVNGGFGALLRHDGESWLVLSRRAGETGELAGGGLRTDGEAACLARAGGETTGWLLAEGTTLAADRVALRADRPLSAALLACPEGWLLSARVDELTWLAVHTPHEPPAEVLVNGRAEPCAPDEAIGGFRLRLAAGEHTVAWGPEPARVAGGPVDGLTVETGAGQVGLEGYAIRRADGLRVWYWGEVSIPQPNRFRLELDGDAALFTCDGADVDPAQPLFLAAGPHWFQIASDGPLRGLKLTPLDEPPGTAEMLPADWAPPTQAVVIEAESPLAEGEVRGRVMEKVAASGGLAHCVWDTLGQWAEWSFEAPAGRYRLLLRMAGEQPEAWRELQLDGALLPGGFVRFEGTGGWCRTQNDWRWFRLPEPVDLSAGGHRLRMVQRGGSMNIDMLALVPEGR